MTTQQNQNTPLMQFSKCQWEKCTCASAEQRGMRQELTMTPKIGNKAPNMCSSTTGRVSTFA